MKIGDLVVTRSGDVGHIESIDGEFADVRYLTPNNEPSCCVGMCFLNNLIPVGENVVPMPRSQEWWDKSNSLFDTIMACLINEGI